MIEIYLSILLSWTASCEPLYNISQSLNYHMTTSGLLILLLFRSEWLMTYQQFNATLSVVIMFGGKYSSSQTQWTTHLKMLRSTFTYAPCHWREKASCILADRYTGDAKYITKSQMRKTCRRNKGIKTGPKIFIILLKHSLLVFLLSLVEIGSQMQHSRAMQW